MFPKMQQVRTQWKLINKPLQKNQMLPVQRLGYKRCEHYIDGPLHFHYGSGSGLSQRLLQTPVVRCCVLVCVFHGPFIQGGVWCTVRVKHRRRCYLRQVVRGLCITSVQPSTIRCATIYLLPFREK